MLILRRPYEESTDLYPGFVVDDGRVTGSITFGQSRLPVWAVLGDLICGGGWPSVIHGYAWPDDAQDLHGVTDSDLCELLYNLLEARGEFGRLLLTIANAERLERDAQDEAMAEQAPGEAVVRIALSDEEEGVHLPAAWWEDPVLSAPVREQLQRCLDVLPEVAS